MNLDALGKGIFRNKSIYDVLYIYVYIYIYVHTRPAFGSIFLFFFPGALKSLKRSYIGPESTSLQKNCWHWRL